MRSGDRGDKPKKHKDRGVKFNEKHALKYGLSVCNRNAATNVVESVMCKFCVVFGKESAADSTRKRRATANIKYFRQPFRADHYLSHLEINHKHKWTEYERSSCSDKEMFFAAHIEEGTFHSLIVAQQQQFTNTQTKSGIVAGNVASVMAPVVQSVGSVRLPASEIEKRIVEELVGELFFNPSDEASLTKDQALQVFCRKEGTDNYDILLKNQRLYDLAIKFVSCGASFRLASRMVQCTKDETKLAYYGGCTDHKVAGYLRAVLASNFQKIALMMRSSWTYALATDAAVHQGTSYLDVRLRIWHNCALQDFHLFSIPSFDQHPAPAIMLRLARCLDVLDSRWRNKLLGTTTNGGVNTGRNTGMTGSQQGLSARIATLVKKPAFYLIWCGVDQLEQVVKNCVGAFCQKGFYDELVSVLAALRQDENSLQNGSSAVFDGETIPDVTASFSTTRGFAGKLIGALKWLMEHRLAIMRCLLGSFPTCVPSASWWVCITVAHRVMAEIAYFMKKLIAMESGVNHVSEQVQELCKLALIMADVVGARRDLWEARATEDACAAGSFQLTYQNAQQFIQNEGGPLAIEMFDTLRGVERLHIAKSVAHFAVDLIAGVATIAQEGRHYCADDVGVLVNPPTVMPIKVFEMAYDTFAKVLNDQESRLRETFSEEEIRSIQTEFDEFVQTVKHEPVLSGVLRKHGRETDISFAWSCVNGKFRLLQEFVGGLATVVPETSAGTLAYLNWEKPDYRQTMVDFALEGILHAKQKTKVELVDIHYVPASTTVNGSAEGPCINLSRAPLSSANIPLGMQTAVVAQDIANLDSKVAQSRSV